MKMNKYQVYATVPLRFTVQGEDKDDAVKRLLHDIDNNLGPSELGIYTDGAIQLLDIKELEEDEDGR